MTRTYEDVLKDIQEFPEKHRHDFSELTACCVIETPQGFVMDASLLEAHAQYVKLGRNGGQQCDVWKGPCACGAWH